MIVAIILVKQFSVQWISIETLALNNLQTNSNIVLLLQAAEIKEDDLKTATECKEQEKATDEDFQSFLSHKLEQSRPGKCLLACIYEKENVVCITSINQVISLNFWCCKL